MLVKRLNTYLQLHYMLLAPIETTVRNLVVEAINHGIDEGFHELAVQADEFQGNHQDGAPMPGTGDVVQIPKFRRLWKLLESDSMSSLAERALGWKTAAPAPSAAGGKCKAAQPFGAAKAKVKKSKNTSGVGFPPSWACRAAWYGDTCRRNGYHYDHVALTQPALPHTPLHQTSLDRSSKLSNRSSNRSSNLNSSPSSSSSSRRRLRGVGFSSQAWPTSAERLTAVEEAEADVEAPTRGTAAPRKMASESLGSANR